MHKYKLIISYDGTGYFGWQKTKMGPSIQEQLEKAIFHLTQECVVPEGASRTDRGVHAEGQAVSFSLQKQWQATQFQRALNAILPVDIRVMHTEEVALNFHPTLDAIGKEYRYKICFKEVQDPVERLYSWAIQRTLNILNMEKAAFYFLGTHDFSSFANEKKKNPICTIKRFEIDLATDGALQCRIVGDRFLYKMARNLVGTLTYVGCGKIPADSIPNLLRFKNRIHAGITAPAHGLTLYRVFYLPFQTEV